MKQRLSSLDLQLISSELEDKVVGYRLRNIYNIAESNRQFLLKFGKPDSKLNVVIDCGLRVHLTDFSRPTPPTPSWFVSKLRQYLKEKRLTGIRQIVNDRIVVFTFADGKFYLVLEFFSAGNVMLLDSDRKILLLFRVVDEYRLSVGRTYDMFGTEEISNPVPAVSPAKIYTEGEVQSWFTDAEIRAQSGTNLLEAKTGKKKNVIPSIQKLLFVNAPHLSNDLIQNKLKVHGVNPSESCLHFKEQASFFVSLLSELEAEAGELLSSKTPRRGYIVAEKNKLYDSTRDKPELEFSFTNFYPFKPFLEPSHDLKIIETEGLYNSTVDTFFSTIESNKYAHRLQAQDSQAKKKLDEAKNNNEKIIQSLLDAQSINEEKGNLLITYADLVEEVRNAVNSLLDQQMDWKSIEKLIKTEQTKGSKIANMIKLPMNLENNQITVILPKDEVNPNEEETNATSDASDRSDMSDGSDESDISDVSDESDSEDVGENDLVKLRKKKKITFDKDRYLNVAIDLSLSAFANSSNYFNVKKATSEKQKKVEQNAAKALKSIEQKIEKDLKKKLKDSHDVLKTIREPYFFEKYYWFISSEGFVIVMGKSPVETDQLYSKYVNDDDILVSNSFEIRGWILNPEKTEVPPNTLMQAGVFVNSACEAWSKKIASSPWWTFAKNLTKFDDIDGSVLPAGSFRIKDPNKRNILPPTQLLMGLGFVWKIQTEDDDSNIGETEDNVAEFSDDADEAYNQVQSESPSFTERMSNLGFDSNNLNGRRLVSDSTETNSIGATSISNASEVERNSGDDDFRSVTTNIVDRINTGVRGKKGKLKKIQKKYMDQDEDERLLRLEALGTLKGIEREKVKKADELERLEKREFRKVVRQRQEQQRVLQFATTEKVNVNITNILNQLKGSISKDDEIADVIPVFAPWSSLTKYKYKVKVQPGTAKKTKSVNDVLNYFLSRSVDASETDKDEDWPREHDAIKLVKSLDFVPIICSDKLKLTIPGSSEKSSGGKTTKGKQSSGKGKKSKK